jgi:DNA repair protein SbcD/Mre11
MTEFRFLHAADIHLDSPMRGLEADPDAPAQLLREASRLAFRNLIEPAVEEQVAFMLIAGDLYDGDWEDWRTGQFFTEQVAKLAEAGIPTVMVDGNHDAASLITRRLRLPNGITRLPHDECARPISTLCAADPTSSAGLRRRWMISLRKLGSMPSANIPTGCAIGCRG